MFLPVHHHLRNRSNLGFTLTELLLVMGISAILLSFGFVNLLGLTRRVYLTTTLNTLISDLRSQQADAMNGYAADGITPDTYGIYFTSASYILFRGNTYNPSDPTNFTVTLSSPLQFTNITFPGNQVVFNQGSGEINGFASGQNALSLTNPQDGQTKTVTLDQFGAVIVVN